MTRANDVIGYFLVALVLLAPIPFGSNPPFFWTLWGLVVGLAATLYFAFALGGGRALRVPLSQMRFYLVLSVVLGLWLVVQALPLGVIFGPFPFTLPDGSTFAAHSLSLTPDSTWLMLIRLASYGLLFLLAVQAGANVKRARLLLTLLFWGIVAHAAFSLIQLTQLGDTTLGFPKTAYLGVATGTFVNRNSFATFLAIGLSLGVALLPGILFAPKARNQKAGDSAIRAIMYGGGLFVILIALLATESRMGLFAGVSGAFVSLLLILGRLPRAGLFIPLAIVIATTVATTAIWVYGQGVLDRALDLGSSSTGRLDLYYQVLDMIALRPWTGYGGGSFEVVFPSFFGPPLELTLIYSKAHSTYLALVAELGLPGALLPIALVATTFIRMIWVQLSQDEINGARIAALGSIVVVALHSTVDFSLEIQANAYLLVAVCGVGLASALNAETRRSDNVSTYRLADEVS